MLCLRSPRRLTAWIILAAWLFATLAPGASRAMAYVQDQIQPWSTVCSAAQAADAGQTDLLLHLTDHCPACTLQGDHLAPPAVSPAGIFQSALADSVPRLFLLAPRPLAIWATAQARAPPLTC